jgi:hypothetical protein
VSSLKYTDIPNSTFYAHAFKNYLEIISLRLIMSSGNHDVITHAQTIMGNSIIVAHLTNLHIHNVRITSCRKFKRCDFGLASNCIKIHIYFMKINPSILKLLHVKRTSPETTINTDDIIIVPSHNSEHPLYWHYQCTQVDIRDGDVITGDVISSIMSIEYVMTLSSLHLMTLNTHHVDITECRKLKCMNSE